MKYILSLLIFVLSFGLNAQKEFKIGMNLGGNLSQVSGDNLAGFHKLGINSGLFVTQSLKDDLSWEMQLNFAQRGSRNTSLKDNPTFYRFQLNYADVVLLVRKPIKFLEVDAGLNIGSLVGFKEENYIGNQNDPRTIGRFDFGATMGVTYKLNEKLAFTGRFINSIWRIRKHLSGATYRWNLGQYNTAVGAQLRYSF